MNISLIIRKLFNYFILFALVEVLLNHHLIWAKIASHFTHDLQGDG